MSEDQLGARLDRIEARLTAIEGKRKAVRVPQGSKWRTATEHVARMNEMAIDRATEMLREARALVAYLEQYEG